MRRVECSMTAKTYRRAPVRVRVSKKSQASRPSAWPRKKSAQVKFCLSGAGGMLCSLRISQTVEAATLMPRGCEFAVDSAVAPCGVLVGEAQDQHADGADCGRTPTSLGHAGHGVAPFEQVTVPAQERLRAYQEE
jgi:hypothetical protein